MKKNLFSKTSILFLILYFSAFFLWGAAPAKTSLQLLRQKAEKGDAESAFYLGDAYFYAKDVKKNPVLAVYWYRKAAESGLKEAQYNLACCLEGGIGCRRNIKEAYDWYLKSYKQNFAPAGMRIFHYHRTGLTAPDEKVIIKPSQEKALAILEKLASQGYEEALLLLAGHHMRRNASGEEKTKAFRILEELTLKPNAPARAFRMLADCYYAGFGCAKDQKKMLLLLQKAAALSDGEAIAKLGFFYEYGHGGLPKDPQKAALHYKKSAMLGHPMGQFKYGETLMNSAGGDKKRIEEAVKWFRSSAQKKCTHALFQMGVLYMKGTVLPKNIRSAAIFFFEAAKNGFPRAQYNLAQMFENGQINGKNDYEAALYWFTQAALQGDVNAIHKAADYYLNGKGVERSYVRGIRLLQEAAKRGDFAARRKLQQLSRAEGYFVPDGF